MPFKTYVADSGAWGTQVRVVEGDKFYWLPLNPSQGLRNHSPDGFNWGYGGSGPAQLSLAILLDLLGEAAQDLVLHIYQAFKFEFIATAPKKGFILTEEQIRNWISTKMEAANV